MNTWDEVLMFASNYRNRTIYIGCSGGIDSMVLVHFLHSNQFNIHVLHVNYHKRGKESDADMELVQNFCKTNNIPFDVRHYEESTTGNFQNNARKFRYDFFREFASKDNGIIALAHHLDDQIETFFINLMRQSGVLGLAGIPPIRENIIRPFLHLHKADVYEYAKKNNVIWREDQSNQSTDYLRNKWRLELIPQMEKSVPNLKKSVEILVNAFQETQQELEEKVRPTVLEIKRTQRLSAVQYASFSEAELFELWRQLGQPSHIFHRFLELKNYPKGKYIETHFPYQKIINEGDYFSFFTAINHSVPQLKLTFVEKLPAVFSKSVIYLNSDKIQGELKIRKWQDGDKIASIGVEGKQSVAQIIKDAKISYSEREAVFVVHDDKNIHWVVGLKIGRMAIPHSDSSRTDTKIIEVKLEI